MQLLRTHRVRRTRSSRTGKQVAIDHHSGVGTVWSGVAKGRWDGQAIHGAQNDKRRRYHELVDGGKRHLFVMAFEVAGRWAAKGSRFSNHCGTSPCRCRGFCAVPPSCCSSNTEQPCWRAPFRGAANGRLQLRERACCLFGRPEQGLSERRENMLWPLGSCRCRWEGGCSCRIFRPSIEVASG